MSPPEDTRPRPRAHDVEAPPEVHVAASPTRCPYCHADVEASQFAGAIVCEQCLSRHHADCWLGRCASCAGERALGDAGLAASRAASFEAWKRRVNWAYLVSFALCFLAVALGLLLDSVVGPPAGATTFGLAVLPTAALSLLLWGVNSYDACVRRQRDPRIGPVPVALALGSPLTGGLTSFIYFVGWGREPLPPDPNAARRPNGSPAKPAERGPAPKDPSR